MLRLGYMNYLQSFITLKGLALTRTINCTKLCLFKPKANTKLSTNERQFSLRVAESAIRKFRIAQQGWFVQGGSFAAAVQGLQASLKLRPTGRLHL